MGRGKVVIIAVMTFAVGALAGVYGGWGLGRSFFGSEWLNEQSQDVEDRVERLRQLRAGSVDEAIEEMEKSLDADLIAMTVDGYITGRVVSNIQTAMEVAREYREEFPRQTGTAFIDDNVARRLAGELTD